MAKVVSFINYKGGVGKSTTAYHVGCALVKDHGMKVLLVDVDPQTNLSFLCATYPRWEDFRRDHGTLASLYQAYLRGNPFDINDIIWKDPIENAGTPVLPGLDLVPSDVDLLGIDLELMAKTAESGDPRASAKFYVTQRTILRNALQAVQDKYDYILIDCPPNLYLVTQNALATSDYFVVTALPDYLSTIGLSILMGRVGALNEDMGYASGWSKQPASTPELGGIIFVRARQGGSRITLVHTRKMSEIRGGEYRDKVFDHITVEGIGYSEAAEAALPVFEMPDQNARRVADQYREITAEFIARIPP